MAKGRSDIGRYIQQKASETVASTMNHCICVTESSEHEEAKMREKKAIYPYTVYYTRSYRRSA